jgi:hypothetical protein
MNSNPIVQRQLEAEEEFRRKEIYRYPFHIVCVYEDEDSNDFPIILETRDYCNKNNLTFMARQYDFEKYNDDMFVKRLPAFHIYHKKWIYETHHYDDNPVHKIQLVVWAYQDEEKEKARRKQRRKEKWDSTVTSFQEFFSFDWMKKKPALNPQDSLSHQRIQEQQKNKK